MSEYYYIKRALRTWSCPRASVEMPSAMDGSVSLGAAGRRSVGLQLMLEECPSRAEKSLAVGF